MIRKDYREEGEKSIEIVFKCRIKIRYLLLLKLLKYTIRLWYPWRTQIMAWLRTNAKNFIKIERWIKDDY